MKKKIITELIKIAKTLLSIEFPSKEALNDYLHEHPNADPRNHSIKPVHNNPKEVKKHNKMKMETIKFINQNHPMK